jgi:hypothetical protein
MGRQIADRGRIGVRIRPAVGGGRGG